MKKNLAKVIESNGQLVKVSDMDGIHVFYFAEEKFDVGDMVEIRHNKDGQRILKKLGK